MADEYHFYLLLKSYTIYITITIQVIVGCRAKEQWKMGDGRKPLYCKTNPTSIMELMVGDYFNNRQNSNSVTMRSQHPSPLLTTKSLRSSWEMPDIIRLPSRPGFPGGPNISDRNTSSSTHSHIMMKPMLLLFRNRGYRSERHRLLPVQPPNRPIRSAATNVTRSTGNMTLLHRNQIASTEGPESGRHVRMTWRSLQG